MIGALRAGNMPLRRRLRWIGDVDDRRPVVLHLPGDGIQLRLVRPAFFLRGRSAAIIRTVSHVNPVAVGCIRSGRDLQRLTPLKIVITDQPYVLGPVRHRIGCRLLSGWRSRLFSASRQAGEKQTGTYDSLLGFHECISERGQERSAAGPCATGSGDATCEPLLIRSGRPCRTAPTATSAGCPEPGRSSGRMTGSLRTDAIPCSGHHSAH